MCIAGDFNQSRDSSGWYEDKESTEMLSNALQGLGLTCVTEDDMRSQGLSRASIDHICLSDTLSSGVLDVKAWEGTTAKGERMSDHNGIFVKLRHGC